MLKRIESLKEKTTDILLKTLLDMSGVDTSVLLGNIIVYKCKTYKKVLLLLGDIIEYLGRRITNDNRHISNIIGDIISNKDKTLIMGQELFSLAEDLRIVAGFYESQGSNRKTPL